MASIETNGLLTAKDKDGNLYLVYPITMKENISDAEEATESEAGWMSASDKSKLNSMKYVIGEDENGVFIQKGDD